MRLPKFAIENHKFVSVVIALLVLSGVVSFLTMPRSEDPLVTPPGTSIVVVFPGASPVDLEQLVVDPMEGELNELEDIKDLSSYIEDGLAVIDVEFETGSDPDEKYTDVTQKVNGIRSLLPDEILSLELIKWTISDTKIMQLALVSAEPDYGELYDEADRLEKSLETVYGVQNIEIEGYPEREVRVSVDIEKLARMGLSLDRVIGSLAGAGANIPGGSVRGGDKTFTLHTSGGFESVEDIRKTVLASGPNGAVYLGDVVDVRMGFEDQTHIARLNGVPAVYVSLSQKEGTNIFEVVDGVRPVLEEFSQSLPAGIELVTVLDQSGSVRERVNGFFSNFLEGVVLVVCVVLLLLGLRASMIIALVIPFSIIIAIGMIDLSGFGIQQMSIVGLVIALGLLVDNAIVVVENISRFMRKGSSPLDAAVGGTSEVGWAIVSATATTLLAFLPLSMLKSTSGDFIRSMPLAVIYCLSASLFVSLTMTPFLSSRFLRHGQKRRDNWIRRRFDLFIEERYGRFLSASLSRPRTVVAAALLIFAGSLTLFPVVGFSLFPKADKPQLIVNIRAPKGTSIERTDEISRYVESVLMDREEIRFAAANVGHGNPRVYYNMTSSEAKSYFGQTLVMLDDIGKDRMQRLINDLRNEFDGFSGARIEVKEFEQGPPVEAPVAIRLIGDDLGILSELAGRVEGMMASVEGTVNIVNPMSTAKTDLRVEIDREMAAGLGVPLSTIDRTVRTAVAGTPVSKYRDARGDEYDVVVRLPLEARPRIEDMDKVMVTSMAGAVVPLRQLATLKFESAPPEINHYKLQRSVLVTADVASGYSIDRTTSAVIDRLDGFDWPAGYRYSVAGEKESREESFSGIVKAMIIAVIAIFGVLVFQFRSYKQPFIVFAAIPFAITGSILALLITGYSFSFMAAVGLTSLVGIVINNSIILVDYTNRLRDGGKGVTEALVEAGKTRFTPIILTTATTISGLLPLTIIGGDTWGGMGWAIIGGLVVSTFLTLIVVPVIYRLSERGEV